jgi:hypothetical protein
MRKSLCFLPDISGFTRFVNNTEPDHSIHIESELLKMLIDGNTTGLQSIEIEDGTLFTYTTKKTGYQ